MEKCPICQEIFKNSIVLLRHAKYAHDLGSEEVYRKRHNIVQNPVCGCGCGEEVVFVVFSVGYREYKRGHKSRVSNNFQTEKSKKNSIKTRRKMLKDGTWKPFAEKASGKHWNSCGLTAATDVRIAKGRDAILNNPKELKKRSLRMKKNRLNGTVPTLSGKNHSQWKGGISSLNHTCRASKRLHDEWKFPKMKKADFKCQSCGFVGYIEVHHDKETFSDIYTKIAEKMGYQKAMCAGLDPEKDEKMINLKFAISDAVADYHIKNKVSGIVLCEKCHKHRHHSI